MLVRIFARSVLSSHGHKRLGDAAGR